MPVLGMRASVATWSGLSQQGLHLVRGLMELSVPVYNAVVSFTVSPQGTIPVWDVLLGFSALAEVRNAWQRWLHDDMCRLWPGEGASVSHIFGFLCSWVPGYWTMATGRVVHAWSLTLLRFLAKTLALGMEHYVFYMYIPSRPLELAPRVLRGRKRRLRQDFLFLEDVVKRARVIGGSTNQTVKALTGQRHLDFLVTHSFIHISSEKRLTCSRVFVRAR